MQKHIEKHIVIIIVVIGVIIFGVRYSFVLSDDTELVSETNITQIKQVLVKNGGELKSGLNLLMVFTPEDCQLCLQEIDFLANYCHSHERLQCFGIVDYPIPDLITEYVKNKKWKFPVYVDNVDSSANFGLPDTPYKLVLNASGKLIFAEGPIVTWRKSGELTSFLEKHLK